MLGFSNQRYTSACISRVNICRNSDILCKTFFFLIVYYIILLLFCLSPLVPCQNMQYINKAEGQIQERHCHSFSFTKRDRKTTEKRVTRNILQHFSQISVKSFCCKCLDLSKPSVNNISNDEKNMMFSHLKYV